MSLFVTILGLLAVTSCVIWIRSIGLAVLGYPLLPKRPRVEDVWSPVATVFALGFLGLLLASNLAAVLDNEPTEITIEHVQRTCLDSLILVIALLLPLLLATRTHPSDFGLGLGTELGEVKYAFGGFVASIVPTFTMLILLLGFRTEETEHPFLKLLNEAPGSATVMWIVFAAVIAAPLAEELMFRVVLQRAAARFMPPRAAIVSIALLFSAVHGWPDALALVPLALILGYVYDQRNSYLSVVLLHALFNGLNLMLKLLTSGEEAAPAFLSG